MCWGQHGEDKNLNVSLREVDLTAVYMQKIWQN